MDSDESPGMQDRASGEPVSLRTELGGQAPTFTEEINQGCLSLS